MTDSPYGGPGQVADQAFGPLPGVGESNYFGEVQGSLAAKPSVIAGNFPTSRPP
jgi:hypothetical protein